jgi:S1-C subfamily serine protease
VSLGIAVQPLTTSMAEATGASAGVMVADVDANGPAAGILKPGDVITGVDGATIASPDALIFSIAGHAPGDAIRLGVVAAAAAREVTVTGTRISPSIQADAPRGGTVFTTVRGIGTRIAVATEGFAALGLAAGDVIIAAGDLDHPNASQLRRLLSTSRSRSILAVVRHGTAQRVVALPPSLSAP